MKTKKFLYLLTSYLLLTAVWSGCGKTEGPASPNPSNSIETIPDTPSISVSEESSEGFSNESPIESGGESDESDTASLDPESTPATDSPPDIPLRDNTPICLVPLADAIAETHNDVASIDYSHTEEGYLCARYTGDCPKVKLRITGPDAVVYTYDLRGDSYETFPLSSGNGDYDVTIYENISGTSYATCLYQQVKVSITNEFGPYLYPNQYVNFNKDSKAVEKGAELVSSATSELEAITAIYDYITSNISYDYDKAAAPPVGYVSNVDAILDSGTGICLDYAALMASMLRSQRIPTRLEVGYAAEAYHAWISIYTEETGWLNGIVEINGNQWALVDPTFGASTDDQTLKKFIGDGTNYILQKMY